MTTLHWEFGSAYDFFISIFVVHHPERFGLRPAWAAGVRSRLSPEDRDFLEQSLNFLPVPLVWVRNLPLEKKDAATVLQELEKTPPEKRLLTLLNPSQMDETAQATIAGIQSSQKIDNTDLENLRSIFQYRSTPMKTREIKKFAEVFLNPAEFGRRYLNVLQAYYQAFFMEEESRISPALKDGLKKGQVQSQNVALAELVEQLSHGVTLEKVDNYEKVILVPSYWTSPLVFFQKPQPEDLLLVYGCRDESQSLVPGEYVPESLVTGLKALADPTRLRILHYLNHGATTPSGLAKKVRLRAPTVIHHLNMLRLAGLVQVTITANGERHYNLRQEAIEETYKQLHLVISPGKKK